MIFVTIGTQEPFDRLVRAMDHWAASHPDTPLFGQLGALKPSSYRPAHFPFAAFMDANAYEARLRSAQLIVAHAGMGSIISALTHAVPIIIMPRHPERGEHRNDHQRATAERFRARAGIWVVDDEQALPAVIDDLLAHGSAASAGAIEPYATPELIEALRNFIHQPRA